MYSVKTDLSFRPVGQEAAPALVEIHAEAFANYWNIHDFNDFFSVANTFAWLAEAEGQAVGMVVLRVVHEQADIITIAVRPGWRRQGIARALMDKAIEKAIEMKAESLFLDVENGNSAAIGLYSALGFAQISRRRLYYRQKDGSYTDALVMSLKLS